jgi:putative transposase
MGTNPGSSGACPIIPPNALLGLADRHALISEMRLAEATDEGIAYLLSVASSDPSRRVAGARNNVCSRYPSRKMGVVIQAESLSAELPGLLNLERSDDVFGYWDQPASIKILYCTKGRVRAYLATPDVLMLGRNYRATFIEFKAESELIALSAKRPNDWVHSDTGWRFLPGEAAAADFGFSFAVISSADFSKVQTQNLLHILPLSAMALSNEDIETLERVRAHLKGKLCSSVRAIRTAADLNDSGVIYRLVAHKQLYRTAEPKPMRQETSQMLAKVFDALRQEGVRKSDIAAELHLTQADLDALTFMLTMSSVPDHGQETPKATPSSPRAKLRLVK